MFIVQVKIYQKFIFEVSTMNQRLNLFSFDRDYWILEKEISTIAKIFEIKKTIHLSHLAIFIRRFYWNYHLEFYNVEMQNNIFCLTAEQSEKSEFYNQNARTKQHSKIVFFTFFQPLFSCWAASLHSFFPSRVNEAFFNWLAVFKKSMECWMIFGS